MVVVVGLVIWVVVIGGVGGVDVVAAVAAVGGSAEATRENDTGTTR